ncbi:MAG TPA: hypothetical protein VH394_06135 [Thermoanaerobaculia bacterium]|jgi:hypothetical protein|nr:hypothetical protein [Thermoanaerobaculia bacterium]
MQNLIRPLGALLALALLPTAIHAADPKPVAAEFPLGTCATCRLQAPTVSGTPSGAFATSWEGTAATDTHGLLSRFYSNKGQARAAERLVFKTPTADQSDAALAADTKNNYYLAWSEATNGNSDVLVQRFKSTGAVLGSAILVNLDDPALPKAPLDYAPAVAALPNGFVVAWVRSIPPGATTPGTSPQIWARRFDAAGKAIGNPVLVSTGQVKGTAPDICVPQGAGPAIAWTSIDERRPFEPSHEGVSLRQLTTAGVVVGTAERQIVKPAADAASVSIACGKSGVFTLAYELDQPGVTDESDVYIQRFSKTGTLAGAAVRINTAIDGRQTAPDISYDNKGNFVVAWASASTAQDAVLARRFSLAGAPLSTAFVVHQSDQASHRPSLPDVSHYGVGGAFVVVWQEGVGTAFGRRFTP